MFDYKGIRERADEAIEMQEDTELFCEDPDGVTHFIEAHETVFITIGRFSPEKGHDRLLAAFEQLRREAEGIGLIIIGGYGDLYQETLNTVRASEFHKDICVIRSIRNPMPILKRCDCFVLPSRYEGLGLVLLEADCLGVPSFATDIQGPRAIMSHYNGCLVEDSEEGILGGMRDYLNGKIRCMDMDYEEYNRKCIGQYEEMMA